MTALVKKIKSFAGDKKGVTLLEYGLLAALIAVACVTTLTTLGSNINSKFSTISTSISGK
jgi:pilus assembly protein Flp/PilA